ncbi:MAG: hypothetical protein QXV73_04860, partial [Candidatus Micrarchaeia archaeon]
MKKKRKKKVKNRLPFSFLAILLFSLILISVYAINLSKSSKIKIDISKLPKSALAITGQLKIESHGGTQEIQTFRKVAIGANNPGNANLYINGSVGIGITNPQQKLEIKANDGDSISILGTTGNDSANLRLITSTNHWNIDNFSGRLRFFTETGYGTGGIERVTIDSSGNVGIGTTAPGQKLTIIGSPAIGVENASTLQAKNSSGTYETFMWPRSSDNVMYINYGSGGFNIRNNSSTSTMFMTNDNKVGIGTTAPAYNLDVSGYGRFTETLGISTTPSTTAIINASKTFTGNGYRVGASISNTVNDETLSGNQTYRGINAYVASNVNSVGSYSQYIQGLFGEARYNGTATSLNSSYAIGVYGIGRNYNTGILPSAYGIFGLANNYASGGTVTNAYGGWFGTSINAGTITNGYGVYIGDIVGTNTFGLYQSNSGDKNYFAGNVGIGTTAPSYAENPPKFWIQTNTHTLSYLTTTTANYTAGQYFYNTETGYLWAISHRGTIDGGDNNALSFYKYHSSQGWREVVKFIPSTTSPYYAYYRFKVNTGGTVDIGTPNSLTGIVLRTGTNLRRDIRVDDDKFWIAISATTDIPTTQVSINESGQGRIRSGWSTGEPDLAEYYNNNPNEKFEFGDLVSIKKSAKKEQITKSKKKNDKYLLGFVSTSPGLIIGAKKNTKDEDNFLKDNTLLRDNQSLIALAGKVPAKVTSIKGNINIGDRITSSYLSGFGMKATQAGPVVGKALESTDHWNEKNCPLVSSISSIKWPEDDGTNPKKPCFRVPVSSLENKEEIKKEYKLNESDYIYVGKIMVFVNVSWYDPDVYLTSTGDFSIQGNEEKGFQVKNEKTGDIIERIGAFAEVIIGKIKAGLISAKKIVTETLFIGETDVGKKL